jgi:glycosyltransferase involved in cell wall biosynthesis
VYDIDDAVHIAPPDRLPRALRWFEDAGQARKIMARARVTLAGNVWLAEETQAAGGRPAVFPTVVDTNHYFPAPQPDDTYRLGWTGSPGTAPYLKLIEEPMRDSGAACLVIGAGSESVPCLAEQRDWKLEDELEQLHRMSVGLMPMPDTSWTRGKCALKALLYMACGRPAICSAGGAADGLIAQGKNGYLARTEQDWRDAIEALRDPVLRARLGAAARATVEERYSLKVWAPRLRELLEAAA